jgi:O-succinylbenzoic acid--CoA ligase
VVIGSGGSSGGRQWCLQPQAHLAASALATGQWLVAQGIDPGACLHLNPLPLHHVSGLMPWVRCRQWGASLRWLPPALLRDPDQLVQELVPERDRPWLLSLVPTQLQRLMATAAGLAWLRHCQVIWVGGAGLAPRLAAAARREGLRLSPCYGATETAAMVCALPPEAFLAGGEGCGPPLGDVELRLASDGAVEVRSARLSPGMVRDGQLIPLPRSADGWWRSGDGGRWSDRALVVMGRLDGALLSGGETVFPEELEGRLLGAVADQHLPLEALLLLGEPDPEWGERLVALVKPRPGADPRALVDRLVALTAAWPPAQRPRRWVLCPSLAPNAAGKWERGRWRSWLGRGGSGEDLEQS